MDIEQLVDYCKGREKHYRDMARIIQLEDAEDVIDYITLISENQGRALAYSDIIHTLKLVIENTRKEVS